MPGDRTGYLQVLKVCEVGQAIGERTLKKVTTQIPSSTGDFHMEQQEVVTNIREGNRVE